MSAVGELFRITHSGNQCRCDQRPDTAKLLQPLCYGVALRDPFDLVIELRDALIEDLHFHDTRREALTRLSKVFDVMELARISGHRDLRVLQNVYYAPSVKDLADKLG